MQKVVVAVDAMGGDFAPVVVVEGALKAAQSGISVSLFGIQQQLIALLGAQDKHWRHLPITIHHCAEIIEMTDEPGRSILAKKDSSLVRAVKSVALDQAHVIVSAGNSGAALISGMLHLGRLPGIARPAIGSFLPTYADSVFCLDLGANVDCKPEYLYQFALMGAAYVSVVKGIAKAKIGLLSNGTEPGKGAKLQQRTFELLQNSMLHFIGNCEPIDVLNGLVDVVVCEGFSGNIMLKSMEATVRFVFQYFKDEARRSWISRLVGLLGTPIFARLKKQMMKRQRGGALLLGVSKPLIITHGACDAQALYDAICFASQVATEGIYMRFSKRLHELIADTNTMPAVIQQEAQSQENEL